MDEGTSEEDILEQRGRPRLRLPLSLLPAPGWRPSRGASVMAALTLAVGLVVGLAVGYAVGHGQGRGAAAARQKPAAPADQASGSGGLFFRTAPPGFSVPAVTENPGTCSVQHGRDLDLGIPVTNQSGETVLLESVKPVSLMSGALRVRSWRWGPCGLDDGGIVPGTLALGPGATAWVTAVVQPLIACPGPAPVQFRVTYSVHGRSTTFSLPGFADLSGVPYSGCSTPPG